MAALLRVAALALPLLVLSGCSGSDDGASPAGAESEATEGSGALRGLVLDDERRPVEGAQATLVPSDRSEVSDPNGYFLFRDVSVGAYEVRIERSGYHNLTLRANVSTQTTTVLTFPLVALPVDIAFHETFAFAGLQQCMIYTNVFLAGCSYPYTAAHGTARQYGVNLTSLGLPPDVLTNKYRYNFTVRADHTGIVSELKWRANSEAARYYVLQLSCAYYSAAIDDCVAPGQTTWEAQNTYARARGVSPLRIEWQHEKPEWLPWVMSRAYLSGPAGTPAGAALDQRIEMWNTVFYGADVPRDWSILAEGTT